MSIERIHLKRLVIFALVVLVIMTATTYFLVDMIIEFWWFDSIGYAFYYATREGYRDLFALFVTLLLTAIFYANFVLYTHLKKAHFIADVTEYNQQRSSLPSLSLRFFIPVSLLLSIPIAIPVYLNWESFLLYFFSTSSGIEDPIYGKDISFYLFKYPVFRLVQGELLVTFSILLAIIVYLYRSTYKKNLETLPDFPRPAKTHITVLIILVVLLQSWSIGMDRIDLLYENRHEPIFYGPGAVETKYLLPIIWLTFLSFLGAAFSVIYYTYQRKGAKLIITFTLCFLVFTGIRQIALFPEMIDRYLVKPNPVITEKSNIQNHINATLDAFDLSHITKIDYQVASTLTPLLSAEIAEELYNIPLWDNALLQNVYEQLQTIQPFYTFSNLSVDRYTLDGKDYQINIAARELSTENLPDETKTWENNHLIYTHGYGVAMSHSSQVANQPIQWLLSNVSMTTDYAKLKVKQPEIYYGMADYLYAIVPNQSASRNEIRSDYQSDNGIKLNSFIRRMMFSTYFGDNEIVLSLSLNKNSRMLFRRNIQERIETIAPFLQLDPDPYPVIVDKRIYWIIDAYTTSNLYPIVAPIESPLRQSQDREGLLSGNTETFNYIRNSVKIIVDAYHGSVDFYVVDDKDPIINAYRRAYPTLLKDISTIPKAFIKHLSYPKTLFTLQMQIYARYHQNKPEIFYQQSDRLQFSRVGDIIYEPYYLTVDPIDVDAEKESERQKFLLLNVMSPIERENLSMITLAGCLSIDNCDEQYKAEIYAYRLPSDVQIDGPAQISALIDQTPEIAEQFSLWNHHSSKVIQGRIIVMPVEESILYIQPIYLAAASRTGFPQLAKVIVAMNHQVAMDDSLELAFKKLEQKLLMAPHTTVVKSNKSSLDSSVE
nr:UPF0182 family protein [Rhodospirillales bacterium]